MLGAQYSAFEPLPGAHVNGDLTMGENIADLGGLLLALDAYHASLDGQPAPVIDGLTGDQRVFLGWAQVWRNAIRPDDAAPRTGLRPALAGAVPRQRRRAQHRRLVRRLGRQARRRALPRARAAGEDLVEQNALLPRAAGRWRGATSAVTEGASHRCAGGCCRFLDTPFVIKP